MPPPDLSAPPLDSPAPLHPASPFSLLSLEACPRVDPDVLRQSFLREASRFHPDTSREPDAAGRFREIQSAYQQLLDPVENLRHFLETAYPGETAPSHPTDLPLDLLALFSRLGPLRQTLATLRTKIDSARSPLAKAVAEREWAETHARMAPIEQELENAWIVREKAIQTWWDSPVPRACAPLWPILRDLKFLQRWRSLSPRLS